MEPKTRIITKVKIALVALPCWYAAVAAEPFESLVPSTPSTAPDYFCTWNVQGYAANVDTKRTRALMTESSLFGEGPFQNWLNLYPSVRSDLLFVMDDSWDIPIEDSAQGSNGPDSLYGSLILSEDRFPSFTGTPPQRLRKLVEAVKAKGWKGLGGWVCAQEAPAVLNNRSFEAYWTERLQWMKDSGFSYWKVDWGARQDQLDWRRSLSALARNIAPELQVEHALNKDAIVFSSAFRTYDVENINSIAPTIDRVAKLLVYKSTEPNSGIINCEDEPYIAAGLGCAIGIMRHPFDGPFPDGRRDTVFPPVGRDLKRRLTEITRGVRWHRIATPFPVANDAIVGTDVFEDYWIVNKGDSWNERPAGSSYKEVAPARISRNLPLCKVEVQLNEPRPFVLASRYPNGAVAIAALGRTLGRDYIAPNADVSLHVGELTGLIGIFGSFRSLTLKFDAPLENATVLAQDLADDNPVDISKEITISTNTLSIPGTVISRIGLAKSPKADKSEPGMVIKINPFAGPVTKQ